MSNFKTGDKVRMKTQKGEIPTYFEYPDDVKIMEGNIYLACDSNGVYQTVHEDDIELVGPKLWKDMTPEEKGAILLAHHEGKVVEWHDPSLGRGWPQEKSLWNLCSAPGKYYYYAYRIRPEPKRETVELWWRKIDYDECTEGRCGTIDLIEGEPDISSIKMEKL